MSKQKKSKTRLLLVDGTAQIFRAFYGIKPLSSPQGEPVNAVYGFTTMMLNTVKQVEPTHIIIAFDRPEPTHRHKLYKDYKAQRQKPPEDLVKQIPVIKQVVEAFGFNGCEKPGYEADDIIATLAVRAAGEEAEVLILSSDKDLFQLVDKHINILRPRKGGKGEYDRLDTEGIKEVFGVLPSQVTDVLALMGDSSDNIPGVPGVGAKTAVDLINQHHSLSELYKNTDSIKRTKLKENLTKHQAEAMQSYELVQVVKNMPLDIQWTSCEVKKGVGSEAIALIGRLGFKRLLSTLAENGPAQSAGWTKGLTVTSGINGLAEKAGQAGVLVMDQSEGNIIMAADGKEAFVLPMDGQSLSSVLEQYPGLLACLEDGKITKTFYDYKPFYIACKMIGRKVNGEWMDIHLAAHLLDLPANGLVRFIERVMGEGLTKEQYPLIACALVPLAKTVYRKLKTEQVMETYEKLEKPLLPVLAEMEYNGVAIDVDGLNKMAAQFGKELKKLDKTIQDEAGVEFNIRSPQQLAEVLFDHLNLRAGKKNKTGRSTSVDVLEALADEHPLPAKVLEYRKLQKIKSTYLDVLPNLLSSRDRRLHTTFNQVGAATGRLSSTDPNLQNIPVRSETGQKIRAMFIPGKKNHLLLSADYSQIELRLMAHLSGDEQMAKDFNEGLDIHRATAAELFNVPLEGVTADMRRQAKTCNFGIAYGVSPFGLAKQIGVSHYRAKEFIDGFYNRYPAVRAYLDGLLVKAREDGFVSTLLGRKRPTPDIHSANRNIREAGERMAINTPIQGSAADLIKLAMIKIESLLEEQGYQSKMILQVHDELLFEGPETEMGRLKAMVVKIMEEVYPLTVPLTVEAAFGENWMVAHS